MAKTRRNVNKPICGGSGECKKITETDYKKLMKMFKEYSNKLEGDFNGVNDIVTINGTSLASLGKGSFNRVFLDKDLVCKGDDFIVRIEVDPHQNPSQRRTVMSRAVNFIKKYTRRHKYEEGSSTSHDYNEEKRKYRNKLSEFITEMQYGIIASNLGVAPDIYQFGSTVKRKVKSHSYYRDNEQYFYSAIQRIKGTSLSSHLQNMAWNELAKTKGIIDQIVEKSDKLGDIGMILYDTKPGNAMVDTEKNVAYLIDFDPKFTHYYGTTHKSITKYGYLNSMLMLAGCIATLNRSVRLPQTTIREYCIKKLKEIYHDQPNRVKYVKNRFISKPGLYQTEDILKHVILHYGLDPILINPVDSRSSRIFIENPSSDSTSSDKWANASIDNDSSSHIYLDLSSSSSSPP